MNEARENKKTFWESVSNVIKKSMDNYLVVSYEGVTKFKISIFALAILFLIFHGVLLIAMVVSLFFGAKYSIAGKDDLSKANRVMETAGNRASEWWNGQRYRTYSESEVNDLCKKYDEKND